jgi:hypothetical protein
MRKYLETEAEQGREDGREEDDAEFEKKGNGFVLVETVSGLSRRPDRSSPKRTHRTVYHLAA